MAEIKVTITIDEEALKEVEQLKVWLRSPNLATAFYNAVYLVNQLSRYQIGGDQILIISKERVIRSLRLPID